MKIIRANELKYIPASHEDQNDPGVWKKVLLKKADLEPGRLQMINWAKMEVGKAFEPHYHEDMAEVFVILSGKVEIVIDGETEMLEKGDAVIIPEKAVHVMRNVGDQAVEYIALGVSRETGGQTIRIHSNQ